jgi:hypothetical protein
MDEFTTRVSAYLGLDLYEQVPSSALSGPLRQLKTQEKGSILMDVERPVGHERIHNLTTFRDPSMKAFIRTIQLVEEQGLLPTSHELEALLR